MTKHCLVLLCCFFSVSVAWADIPATPVMTLYQFNGDMEIPYYALNSFGARGPGAPAGTLVQGTSVIPCVAVQNGQPVTDQNGVPYVGFQVVVDPRNASREDAARFTRTLAARNRLMVTTNQCDAGVRYVLDIRNLYRMNKPPIFDPPRQAAAKHYAAPGSQGELDQVVRSFHNSAACGAVTRSLLDRRSSLRQAWNRFIREEQGRWPLPVLQRAEQLDYVMRTALFEGHLDRGCSAYGACERNIVALSIRNRGQEDCSRKWGCSAPGDFVGVASKVSQYNIWDGYLTQVSGLTLCYLRNDLTGPANAYYEKLQSMYSQNVGAVQRILFGNDRELQEIFPGNSLAALRALRHYYHAPAMGKCFPQYDRVDYISGAIARRGDALALITQTRIQVGPRQQEGYFFKSFDVRFEPVGDVVRIVDRYPGFVIDGRRVSLQGRVSSSCRPYGVPAGCRFDNITRYRRTPSWVNAGQPVGVVCRVHDRGASCRHPSQGQKTVRVGSACDTEMRPFSGIK